MSPNQWGPPIWIFFHTLAEKVKETSFSVIGKPLIMTMYQICSLLPCPECSQHAKSFWSKVNINNIKTKNDLINMLFVFHNSVNQRKKQKLFSHENLSYYKTRNVIETYNNFARNYNTHGNMNLLTDSFHRVRLLGQIKKWLVNNIQHFDI
jgi:hypothetical protein